MTLSELHRHAAALQAGGGPLAGLGDELAEIQDPSEAGAILQRYQGQLQQRPGPELNDEELGSMSGGALAASTLLAALYAQMQLSQAGAATASLVHASSRWPFGT